MSSSVLMDILFFVLVAAVLAIPVAFSYTAIRKRRVVGRPFLRWRPRAERYALLIWCLAGLFLSTVLYRYYAPPYMKLIFIGAFFSGLMNVLGSTIIIGEKGIIVHRRAIMWKDITQFSTWEKSGKHYMSVTWRNDSVYQKEQSVSFGIPARMIKITLALFQNFIPSIQLPRSN